MEAENDFQKLASRRLDFQSERLNKLEGAISNLEKMARRFEESDHKANKAVNYLFGNGVPGMDERVRNLEAKVEGMNDVVKDWAKAVKWVAGVGGGYVLLEIVKFILANI